jgi:hypothetical protein
VLPDERARIGNIAGHQRLRSPRAAKSYVLEGANVDANAMTKAIADSRLEFENGLRSLAGSRLSNDRIKAALWLADSQRAFYETALSSDHEYLLRSWRQIFQICS